METYSRVYFPEQRSGYFYFFSTVLFYIPLCVLAPLRAKMNRQACSVYFYFFSTVLFYNPLCGLSTLRENSLAKVRSLPAAASRPHRKELREV